jgi:hypothetical protein
VKDGEIRGYEKGDTSQKQIKRRLASEEEVGGRERRWEEEGERKGEESRVRQDNHGFPGWLPHQRWMRRTRLRG